MDVEIRFVICIENEGYRASLERLKLFMALSDGEPALGLIRVVDESGEDNLSPSSAFVEVTLPQPEAERFYGLLQVEAGKAADAPHDALPDAIRPWLAEAEEFIEENEEAPSDRELDSITNGHLATEATTRPKEVTAAMRRAQGTKNLPSSQMLQITRAHRRLLSFSEAVIKHYKDNFAEHPEDSYGAVKEAERILRDQGR